MPLKKKDCPNCGVRLKEVRWAEIPKNYEISGRRNPIHLYPKLKREPGIERDYHEYRFVCPGCKKEWVYDSLWREFLEVPKDSQFYYSWEKQLLVLRKTRT